MLLRGTRRLEIVFSVIVPLLLVVYNSLAWPAPPMTSHIGGVSPGTDDGAITIMIPSPTIASASGTSMAGFAGGVRGLPGESSQTAREEQLDPEAAGLGVAPRVDSYPPSWVRSNIFHRSRAYG